MKKLMIAVAIVYAAVVSQAATVDWTSSATSAYNGQKLYLLNSIAETYDSLEAFEATAVDVGTVTKVASSYKVSKRTAQNDAITKSANYYLAVVVNDDTIHYLDVTSTFQPMVFDPPEQSPGNASVAFANVATSATTATIGAVPEPTSGLLLLLGVAGLALKRKRA